MKLFVFAFCLSLFYVGLAFEALGNFKDPAHPGKCVTNGLILSPGEEGYPKGECIRILCGTNSLGTIQGCGATDVTPPCKEGGYKYPDAPYPKCCERIVTCP